MQRPSAEARDGHYIAYSGWRDRWPLAIRGRRPGSPDCSLCDATTRGRVAELGRHVAGRVPALARRPFQGRL